MTVWKTTAVVLFKRRLLLVFGLCPSALIAAPAPTVTHDFYIARDTPANLTASGSLVDPFTVNSAADLDTVLASIPTFSHIHFLPGDFPIGTGAGAEGYAISGKDGWTISGAGLSQTKLSNQSNNTSVLIFSNYTTEITDLTLDGRASQLSKPHVQGICIVAHRGLVERVCVTDTGGSATNEAFPISLIVPPPGTGGSHFIVRDCYISNTSPVSNGSTAICLARWSSGGVPAAAGDDHDCGIVEGNYLDKAGSLGIVAFNNAVFRNNHVDNTGVPFTGFNFDTGAAANLLIENNVFDGSTFPYTNYGVVNIAATCVSPRITGNKFNIDQNGYKTAGIWLTGSITDPIISDNTFVKRGAAAVYSLAVSGSAVKRLRVLNNRISDSLPVYVSETASDLFLISRDNRTLTGDAIPSLPDLESNKAASSTSISGAVPK